MQVPAASWLTYTRELGLLPCTVMVAPWWGDWLRVHADSV